MPKISSMSNGNDILTDAARRRGYISPGQDRLISAAKRREEEQKSKKRYGRSSRRGSGGGSSTATEEIVVEEKTVAAPETRSPEATTTQRSFFGTIGYGLQSGQNFISNQLYGFVNRQPKPNDRYLVPQNEPNPVKRVGQNISRYEESRRREITEVAPGFYSTTDLPVYTRVAQTFSTRASDLKNPPVYSETGEVVGRNLPAPITEAGLPVGLVYAGTPGAFGGSQSVFGLSYPSRSGTVAIQTADETVAGGTITTTRGGDFLRAVSGRFKNIAGRSNVKTTFVERTTGTADDLTASRSLTYTDEIAVPARSIGLRTGRTNVGDLQIQTGRSLTSSSTGDLSAAQYTAVSGDTATIIRGTYATKRGVATINVPFEARVANQAAFTNTGLSSGSTTTTTIPASTNTIQNVVRGTIKGIENTGGMSSSISRSTSSFGASTTSSNVNVKTTPLNRNINIGTGGTSTTSSIESQTSKNTDIMVTSGAIGGRTTGRGRTGTSTQKGNIVQPSTKITPREKEDLKTGEDVTQITEIVETNKYGYPGSPGITVTNITYKPPGFFGGLPPIPFIPGGSGSQSFKGFGFRGKQKKGYTPTGYSAAFNIKGTPTKLGTMSGLGIRPIRRKKRKK